MAAKHKARDVGRLSPEAARRVWPTYMEWALQLFQEESPVQDRCDECGKVLHTYPTDLEKYVDTCESKFGPMPNVICGDCVNPERKKEWLVRCTVCEVRFTVRRVSKPLKDEVFTCGDLCKYKLFKLKKRRAK